MTKWEYIRLISKRGSHYGVNGGVLDLLHWCGKPNTAAVTKEEAKAFWELYDKYAGVSPISPRLATDDDPINPITK